MPIASGKPDSRMRNNPNSFDAASTSQVRLKGAYLGGSMEKQWRNPSHQEEEDSEDSDNFEAEIWYYKGKQVTGKPVSLHTEPVPQLIRKVNKIQKKTWKQYLHRSPDTSHCLEAIFSMVREFCGRQPGDPMKDLDVSLAVWGMFMNTTLRAAVHLGKDCDMYGRFLKNHLWKTTGQFWKETEKLISGQAETTGISFINLPGFEVDVDKPIAQSSLSIFHCHSLYVLSDSVLCLGKMGDDLIESWNSKVQCLSLKTRIVQGHPVVFLMNRCSQRRTTVARDQGRHLGLASATGLRAGRQRSSHPPLSRASGERRSLHDRGKLLAPSGGTRAQLRQIHWVFCSTATRRP